MGKTTQGSRPNTSHKGADRVGAFDGSKELTKEEFEEWAQKLWNRIDRDHGGSISREELNCDEFQDVLRSVIAPQNTGDGVRATYGRAEIHIEQALDFCLRKASVNPNGELSFKEFKSFMKQLMNQGDPDHVVHLIFALFDLDGSQTIDKEEFVGIYRFYIGHQPTLQELNTAFEQMDRFDKGEVTRKQFVHWVKTDAPEQFKQHSAGVKASSEAGSSSVSRASVQIPKGRKINRPAPGLMPRPDNAPTWSNSWHSMWNERFRGRDHALMNPTCPERLKHYFMPPQTVPELDRFYRAYSGFEKHLKRLHKPPSPRNRPVLSTDSKTLEVSWERAAPGGTQVTKHGDPIPWINDWPEKACELQRQSKSATLLLRCPGKAPPGLLLGREAEHKVYRAELMRKYGQHALTQSQPDLTARKH